MNKHCIYKLKEGKELTGLDYAIGDVYVSVDTFAYNHSTDEMLMMAFERIDPDTLEYKRTLGVIGVMNLEDFKEHFELYMDQDQIRDKIKKEEQ